MRTRTVAGHVDGFEVAVAAVRSARVRPEVTVTEVPAPSRIAPHAYAVTADVISGDEELATGRFVLLHDPSAPEAWDGEWRCVTFARAEVETELATDPMVGVAGWSWLTDALHERELTWLAEAGTVTRVVSEGFGGLSDNTCTVDMEIRASWTPVGPIADHFTAWTEALCAVAGLLPLPDGVVALPGQRR